MANAGPVICRPISTYPCTQMKVFSARKLAPPDTRCLVELKEIETQLFRRVYLSDCPEIRGNQYMAIQVTCNPEGIKPTPPDALRVYPAAACETPPGAAKRKQVEEMVAKVRLGDRMPALVSTFTKLYRVFDHSETFEPNPEGEDHKYTRETWIFHEFPGISVYVPVAAKVKHNLHAPKVADFFVSAPLEIREEYVSRRECEAWGGVAKKKGPNLYEFDCKLPKEPKLERK